MNKNILDFLRAFRDDTKGSFAIMFVMTFLVVLSTIGLAIDMAMLYSTKARLQIVANTAALFVAKSAIDEDKESLFLEFANEQWQINGKTSNVKIKSFSYEEVDRIVTVTGQIYTEQKYMLISGLVNDGQDVYVTSHAELGVQDIEVVLALDISSSMAGTRITEARASSKMFAETLLESSSLEERIKVSLVPFGGNVRVPAELNYILNTPIEGYTEFSNYWIGGDWNQCFDFSAADVTAGLSPTDKFDALEDIWSWRDTNPWCPLEGNEFVPLTNDLETLKTRIDNLSLSDGTGSDRGMLWAYENLNSAWKDKFPDAHENTPAELNTDTKKIIVFMTDGGITGQHYIKPELRVGTPPFYTQKISSISRSESLNAFYDVCDRAKDNNIEVYTIGYLLTKQSHKNELTNCSSSNGHYIDASTGDLDGIFMNIANSITPLKLTR